MSNLSTIVSCVCDKSCAAFRKYDYMAFVWFSHCTACVHHPLFNDISQQKRRTFITLKLLDMTRKETTRNRDRCPRALIVSTIDMSDNQHFHRHAIQISSHRYLWYCSRHCSFVVPHVCHSTSSPHTPHQPHNTNTHTHAHTYTHSSLSVTEMTIDVFGFEMC